MEKRAERSLAHKRECSGGSEGIKADLPPPRLRSPRKVGAIETGRRD